MNNKFLAIALLLIAFSLLNFSAINKNEKDELKIININVSNFKNSANLSDFLEVVKLIPLETSKESLIGEINNVVQFRENIYVFDLLSQKLLWFNSDGKFLGQIGQRGKGPGEYIEMHDFQVDTLKELIYLSDFRKIHIFSLKGKWIKSVNTEFMASALCQSANNEFIFYGGGREDRIFRTDSDFKVINSFFPYSTAYRMTPRYPLFNYEGKTAFHLPTCDTIYAIKDGKPKPLFYFDFNGKNFTKKDFDRLSPAEQENVHDYLLKGGRYAMCAGFLPLKNSAILSILYSGNAYWGMYNLSTNQYSMVPLKKLTNDIFGPFMYFHPSGIVNDAYVFAMPPDILIKDKSNSFYKKYNKVLDGITELSNPVLLVAKAKI